MRTAYAPPSRKPTKIARRFGAARPRAQARSRIPPHGDAIRTFPRAAPAFASLRDAQCVGRRVGGAAETSRLRSIGSTSLGLAFSLGRQDGRHAVSREEAIAHAALLARVSALPVNGDLEDGFGARAGGMCGDGPRRDRGGACRSGDRGYDCRFRSPDPRFRHRRGARSRSRPQPLADASCLLAAPTTSSTEDRISTTRYAG